MKRAASILAGAATAALFLGGLGAAPAFAADSTPTTFDELFTALFVNVILGVTHSTRGTNFAGLAI